MKLQALDATGAPEKYQVFRAKHTLGMGAVTLLLSGPVQSPLPRPAKPEQRVSFLNPALEGATCYCSGMPVPSFAAVRCPGDTQAPTDQSLRSFTSLHTASIWIRGEKRTLVGQPNENTVPRRQQARVSWSRLNSQLVALIASSTAELLIPGSFLILRGMVPCLPRHF